jgi:hypothetical protein
MKRRRASVVRFRMLRIMTGTVPLVLVGIYLCHLGLSTLTNRRSSYNITTDSGTPLKSIFDGAQAAGFATPSYRSAAWARLPDASVAASDPAVF